MSEGTAWLYFVFTVILALILSVAPLPFSTPDWVAYLRPEWVMLGWYFWLVFQSERCSYILAFLTGMVLDVLHNEPLGLNSLILITLVYLGRQGLRFLQPNVGLKTTVFLLGFTVFFSFIKYLVLLTALNVQVDWVSLLIKPLVTVAFWLPLIPLLSSDASQLSQEID